MLNGDYITCPCSQSATASDDTITTFSIEDDYLRGRGLQIIGYSPDPVCDETIYLRFNDATPTNDPDFDENYDCYRRGKVYRFEISTMMCGDDYDLRLFDYEIAVWPSNKQYVIDYHKQKCLTPGGDDAQLTFFKEDNSDPDNVVAAYSLCRRLSLNGW